MKALWELGEATVPILVHHLNLQREREPITRGTVQVLLNRIESKGWVERRKEGRAFVYVPVTSAEEGLAELTGAFQSKVFDGSALSLVQALVKSSPLKRDDIEELRTLLDEAESKLEKEGE